MKLPSGSCKTSRRDCIPRQEAGLGSAWPGDRHGDVCLKGGTEKKTLQEASATCSPGVQLCQGCGQLGWGELPRFWAGYCCSGAVVALGGISLRMPCLQGSTQRGNTRVGGCVGAGGSPELSLVQGGPRGSPWPRSQGREPHRVPASPAGVSPAIQRVVCRHASAGSSQSPSQAPQALAPPGAPPCAAGCSALPAGPGRLAAPVPSRLGPGEAAMSRRSWSPLQNPLPSHPHPPPLTSGSFRMQLNTSALKISGANCLVMKTLITGQLKP